MVDKGNASQWRQGSRFDHESRYEGRKVLITQCARACFERKGVTRTSIADITREVGITRELFYYYFKNKAQVQDVVMDTYVADAVVALASGIADEFGAPHDALVMAVASLRTWLATAADAEAPMLEILRETDSMATVFCRVAEMAIRVLRKKGALVVNEGESETAENGRKMALVGALCTMTCTPYLSDAEVATSIEPLFW